MLGKKSNPVLDILTGSFVSGHISAILDFVASPRSDLESKPQSPRSLFDFVGVGLGIVANLEDSGDDRNEIPANKALFGRNLSKTNPILIHSQKSLDKKKVSEETTHIGSLEEYTIVTCHGPNESYTKVYGGGRKGDDRTPFRIQNVGTKNRPSIFHISPVKSSDDTGIPLSDFLNSCHSCHKKLHGKDIYMYRGEKAFCSTECRYKQIVIDERTEKCGSEAARPVDVSGSPYANERILTTGILAV